MDIMQIQVVGPGCYKCETVLQNVRAAVAAAGVEAVVEKVDDPFEFGALGVNRTPAILIDGQLKVQGRVVDTAEIQGWIQSR